MNDFISLPGRILLRASGVFKQADLFGYNGRIFAKYGQGYIGISSNGDTSKRGVMWTDLELDVDFHFHIGKLVLGRELLSPGSRKSLIHS